MRTLRDRAGEGADYMTGAIGNVEKNCRRLLFRLGTELIGIGI